jgi:hypothetical protein
MISTVPNREWGHSAVAFVRMYPVTDRNGDQLTLYEFQDRRFVRKVRRLKLCSGETVQKCGKELVVIGTGERLELVDACLPPAATAP